MNEFKPRSWAVPVQDLVKEYNAYEKANDYEEIQTAPEEISKSMVRRGIMNPMTGHLTGNSKASKVTRDNCSGFSTRGKRNYEQIFGHP